MKHLLVLLVTIIGFDHVCRLLGNSVSCALQVSAKLLELFVSEYGAINVQYKLTNGIMELSATLTFAVP